MKGLTGWLIEEGTRTLSKAAERLAASGPSSEVVARAVGVAQRGLQALSAVQEQALHTVGLAARPDYDDVKKRLARLKRKVRDLDRKVGGPAAGGGAGDGEGR